MSVYKILYFSLSLAFISTIAIRSNFKLKASVQKMNHEDNKKYEDLVKLMTESTDLNFEDKTVLVDFWASWCLPCVEKLKEMPQLIEKYPKLKVVTINIEEVKSSRYKSVIKKYCPKFKNLFDEENVFAKGFNIDQIPTLLIFRHGKLVQRYDSLVDFNSIEFNYFMKRIVN